MDRHLYLVAYDVADSRRLRRVHKTMRGYGDPLQYSVFLCELSATNRERLLSDLSRAIHHLEDRVLIAELGPAGSVRAQRLAFLGQPLTKIGRGPLVF